MTLLAIVALSVAATLAAPAGAANADLPTVFVTGSFRYVWDQPAAASPWFTAVGVESWQLRPKDAVEVRQGGTCVVGGVVHRSTAAQTAICSGGDR